MSGEDLLEATDKHNFISQQNAGELFDVIKKTTMVMRAIAQLYTFIYIHTRENPVHAAEVASKCTRLMLNTVFKHLQLNDNVFRTLDADNL